MKKFLLILFASLIFIAGNTQAQDRGSASQPEFDFSLAGAGADTVSWHGYYEFEYLSSQDKPGTFDAHKLTMWMGVKVGPWAYLSSEVEYEHAPQLAGGSADGKIIVDSAQLRLTPAWPLAGSMGLFYVPFGIEYLSYPGHLNKLVTRPKAMKGGGVIPGTWSDVGAGLTIALGPWGVADIYAVNGDARNGRVALDSAEGGNESKTIGGRLMINGLVPGLNFGASIAEGKWDKSSKLSSARLGAHLRAELDSITKASKAPVIIGEWVAGVDESASAAQGKDKKVSGYYLQASSMILPMIEIAARYGAYDSDGTLKNNARTELSFGASWLAMKNLRFKAEYQINGEEGKKQKNDLLALQAAANW